MVEMEADGVEYEVIVTGTICTANTMTVVGGHFCTPLSVRYLYVRVLFQSQNLNPHSHKQNCTVLVQ